MNFWKINLFAVGIAKCIVIAELHLMMIQVEHQELFFPDRKKCPTWKKVS